METTVANTLRVGPRMPAVLLAREHEHVIAVPSRECPRVRA
jgi:hypothetical protein